MYNNADGAWNHKKAKTAFSPAFSRQKRCFVLCFRHFCASIEPAESIQQLGGQQCAACGAAKRIMRKTDELEVKNIILSQPTDGHTHTAVNVAVKPCLRAVRLVDICDELFGCMRKLQLLREPFEIRPTLKHSIDIRLSPEFDRNCCKVSVGDGNTYALCGNHGSFGVDDHIAVNMSPYLERLSFALFLFAADIRNDVVDDFGEIGKRFAGARNCLEGCDEDCTLNLCSQTLRNLAVSFAGVTAQ